MWNALIAIVLIFNMVVIMKLALSVVALRERMRRVERACGVDFWENDQRRIGGRYYDR